jgi:predicted acylesterase/phospholipase RssA
MSRIALAPKDRGSRPKRSLILAGGGMRVAWQAGVLLALEEEGLTYFHADGTSGGTMNLAMLFSGLSPREMCARWRTLDVTKFASALPLDEYLDPARLPAMGDADGLVRDVFPHLGIDVEAIRRAEGMAGTFNVCNFTRKTNEAVPNDQIALDLLVAAVSLPLFMPVVPYGGFLYLDSVWIKDANVWEAVRRGAEELWLVWCIGNAPVYRSGAFPQYVQMIELSANGKLFEELDRVRDLNDRIARGDSPYGQQRPVTLHVVKPRTALPLDPDFFLGRIDAATLIGLGYQAARRTLANQTVSGVPLTWEATTMTAPKNGVSFREKMAGAFALGETDPVSGEKKGQATGSAFEMHGTISVEDIDRFVSDPHHAGGLTATVGFTPFGTDIVASSGVFNLFSPGGEAKTRLMVYELGFRHRGEDYYFAGSKKVRDDPGLDLWPDTTTLYSRLHKGTDDTGPVVGAGILRLGVADLVRLVSTLHATGTSSAAESAAVLGKFGRFFLGQLWDTYVQHLPPAA